ncbi:MAG: VWA domain-containing protein [Betaproteobacteria bacterium]|nr:VWA domain-containing protein [Betaproteobacteria bacterium]
MAAPAFFVPVLAALALLSGCAVKPVNVEAHATQAGKMEPGSTEDAFRFVQSVREPESIVLIYDASGSMAWPISAGGEPRFGPAYRALLQFVDRTARHDKLAIIVYGSQLPSGIMDGKVLNAAKAKASCNDDIRVVQPLQPAKDRAEIKGRLNHLSKVGAYRGDTPLGNSMMKAAELLANAPGEKRVVVLTDGAEECHPQIAGSVSPRDAVQKLKDADIAVDIVFSGGGLDSKGVVSERSKENTRNLSTLATGQFFEAGSYDELVNALLRIEIAKFRYELVSSKGAVAATANLGQQITLPAGEYTFRGLKARGFSKPVTLPAARAARIYLALSGEEDATPDVIVVAEK